MNTATAAKLAQYVEIALDPPDMRRQAGAEGMPGGFVREDQGASLAHGQRLRN
jgi:hypothetical protein